MKNQWAGGGLPQVYWMASEDYAELFTEDPEDLWRGYSVVNQIRNYFSVLYKFASKIALRHMSSVFSPCCDLTNGFGGWGNQQCQAFLQVPLPPNLPRLLDDGERARKAMFLGVFDLRIGRVSSLWGTVLEVGSLVGRFFVRQRSVLSWKTSARWPWWRLGNWSRLRSVSSDFGVSHVVYGLINISLVYITRILDWWLQIFFIQQNEMMKQGPWNIGQQPIRMSDNPETVRVIHWPKRSKQAPISLWLLIGVYTT